MNGLARLMLVTALSLVSTACGLNRAALSLPVTHDFGPEPAATPPSAVTWSVASSDAPAWLQDDRIRYRLLYADPSQVRFYTRDVWAAPPPQLLAQRIDLAGAGGGGRYRLRVQVREFEQVFDQPDHARAVLRLRVSAYRPDSMQPVAERWFQFDEPTPSADAPGAVAAYSGLADRAIGEIRAWLTNLPPVSPP